MLKAEYIPINNTINLTVKSRPAQYMTEFAALYWKIRKESGLSDAEFHENIVDIISHKNW